MTRTYVLLDCLNAPLNAAKVEGYTEREDQGGLCVLLPNPRWEKRFTWILELSGAETTMSDGTIDDHRRAKKMDQWIMREGAKEAAREWGDWLTSFLTLSIANRCQGDPYPDLCAQRAPGEEDFLCGGLWQGPRWVSYVERLTHQY